MKPLLYSPRSFAILCSAFIAAASVTQPISDAAVVLALTDSIGAPTSVSLLAGDTFTLTLTLSSSTESTSGLAYLLEAPEAGSSFFRIVGRDIGGSTYSTVTTPNDTVLVAANALLDPQNNDDLGAGVSDPSIPNGPGDYFVATLSLQALPTIPLGSYTIQLASNAVVSGPAPGFDEIVPTRESYTVNVVPEPSSVMLMGLGLMALAGRRRSLAKRG